MNKKMKKIIATIVLTGGIFSQFPVAFCSGSSEEIDLLIESILRSDDKESKKTSDVNNSKIPAKTLAEKEKIVIIVKDLMKKLYLKGQIQMLG